MADVHCSGRQLHIGRIRHLPVIDDGKICGLVSIGDVVKRRIMDTEAEAEALKSYIVTG